MKYYNEYEENENLIKLNTDIVYIESALFQNNI